MVINKETLKHTLLICFLFSFEIAAYLSRESLYMYAAIASVAMLVILLLSRDNVVHSILFILPNQRLFVIPGTDFSLITLFVLFIFLSNFKNIVKVNRNIIPIFLLIMVYSCIPSFVNSDILFPIQAAKVLSVFFVFNCFFLKSVGQKEESNPSFLLFYVFGVISVAILGSIFDPEYSVASLGTRIRFTGGEFNNPNILGFEISFAISLLLVDLYYMKKRVLFASVTIVTLLVFGFMTQSRSFYFISILSFGSFFLSLLSLTDLKKMLVAIVAGGVILFTMFLMGDSIIEIFNAGLERITNPKNNDISASRFTLWSDYSKFLIENILFLFIGIGFKDILETVGTFNVAHNAVLEVVVSWGLVGLLLFLVIFFQTTVGMRTALSVNRTKTKVRPLGYLPLVVLFLSSMTGHSFLSNPFVIKFLIATFVLFSYREKSFRRT